jgi:hypothetical protein
VTLLFDKEALPRKSSVKRMRVADAGNGPGCKVIQFVCPHCNHDTGWIKDEKTITENKRGLPCPKCNPSY